MIPCANSPKSLHGAKTKSALKATNQRQPLDNAQRGCLEMQLEKKNLRPINEKNGRDKEAKEEKTIKKTRTKTKPDTRPSVACGQAGMPENRHLKRMQLPL